MKKQTPSSWLFILYRLPNWTTSENVGGEILLKTFFLLPDVYINMYDTKDTRSVSSQKELMYLIVVKYVAFSALCVVKQKLILLEGIVNNNKHF